MFSFTIFTFVIGLIMLAINGYSNKRKPKPQGYLAKWDR